MRVGFLEGSEPGGSLALAALKFCFKTCVAMKFVDDDDDDDFGYSRDDFDSRDDKLILSVQRQPA